MQMILSFLLQNCDIRTGLNSCSVFGTNDPNETFDDDGGSFYDAVEGF